MSIDACRLIDFPKIIDGRGALSVIESGQHIPFELKRIFYLYDVAEDEQRGDHANIKLQQVLIAIAGSFTVRVDDGFEQQTYKLSEKNTGLYIPGMFWRWITDFSPGTVCMVLCSDHYNADDYFRDYAAFRQAVQKGQYECSVSES